MMFYKAPNLDKGVKYLGLELTENEISFKFLNPRTGRHVELSFYDDSGGKEFNHACLEITSELGKRHECEFGFDDLGPMVGLISREGKGIKKPHYMDEARMMGNLGIVAGDENFNKHLQWAMREGLINPFSDDIITYLGYP